MIPVIKVLKHQIGSILLGFMMVVVGCTHIRSDTLPFKTTDLTCPKSEEGLVHVSLPHEIEGEPPVELVGRWRLKG